MATVMSSSLRIGNKLLACDDEALEIRLKREQPGQPITVFTSRQSEPLLRRYKVAQVAVRHDGRKHYASKGDLTVTAERFILLLCQGDTGKGSQRYTLFTFPREMVASPERRAPGMIASAKITFSTADGSARAEFTSGGSKLDDVLRSLQPSSINELGSEAAAIRTKELDEKAEVQRQREAIQAAKIAEQELERVAAVAQRFESEDARKRRGPVSLSAGGVFDHRKKWHYRVAASPSQCADAFTKAFSAGGGLFFRAKWSVESTPDGAVAIYQGRKGLAAAATLLSDMAAAEQDGAIGSEIKFEIVGQDGDHTMCAMWLAVRASRIGFTNDGRFFRPYMRSVESELHRIDPSVQVVKD